MLTLLKQQLRNHKNIVKKCEIFLNQYIIRANILYSQLISVDDDKIGEKKVSFTYKNLSKHLFHPHRFCVHKRSILKTNRRLFSIITHSHHVYGTNKTSN